MFHVVTDTDDTAKRLLDIMNREKTGRLTFMPLNRLRPNVPTYPDAQDAIPLIQKLRFNDRDAKAFQQVFGKTCVCRDLTIAAAYVKSVTINGVASPNRCHFDFYDVFRVGGEVVIEVTADRDAANDCGAGLPESVSTGGFASTR